jgi:ankyrin repeat protein
MGAMRIIIIACLCLYVVFVIYVTNEKIVSFSTAIGLISAAIFFIILNVLEMRKLLNKTQKEYDSAFDEDLQKSDNAAKAVLDRFGATTKQTAEMNESIHELASSGDVVKMRAYLAREPELVYNKDNKGRTPLHCAVSGGSEEAAEYLLSNGIDINVRDNDDRTPLHAAAESGSTRIMELLLAKGAKVNARDREGFTPLNFAMKFGKKEVETILLRHGAFLKPHE